MIFTCLTGNCRNVLKQLHELIRKEHLDCMCGFQQSQNSVFLAKQKIIATRNSIFINLMDFSLNGSTQTFHTLNELNACRTSVQHSKVRWRAVARRSSQLKPYLLRGPTCCLGGHALKPHKTVLRGGGGALCRASKIKFTLTRTHPQKTRSRNLTIRFLSNYACG